MKIEFDVNELRAGLGRVMRVIKSGHTIPILANVAMQAAEGEIVLIGNDLTTEIIARVPATVTEEGEATLPAKKLADVAKYWSGTATLAVAGNEAIAKCQRSRVTMATLPYGDYPAMEKQKVDTSVTVEAEALSSAIDVVKHAMGKGDCRHYLNGMYVSIRGGTIAVVAIDGHRVARTELPSGDAGAEWSGIVPRDAVLLMGALLAEGGAVLSAGHNVLVLKTENELVSMRLIAGKYPDYAKVIDRPSEGRMVAPVQKLISMVEQSIAARSQRLCVPLRMTAAGGVLSISSSGDGEDFFGEMDEIEGEMDVSLDAMYLRDTLRAEKGAGSAVIERMGEGVSIVVDDTPSRFFIAGMRL